MRIAALASLALASLAGHTAPEFSCPYVIRGRITDENGSPLHQANVSIVGTDQGAMSDVKGDYRLQLNCPRADGVVQVRIRRIGYQQLSRPLTLARESEIRLDVRFTNAQMIVIGLDVLAIPDAEPIARRGQYADFRATTNEPATFVAPFDALSFSAIRRFLNTGEIPPADAFSIEGLIQHPNIEWPASASVAPLALVVDEIPAPWAPRRAVVRATLAARPPTRARAPRNVVLVVDASSAAWHLIPRIRQPIARIVSALDDRDRVSIVAFNGPRAVLLAGARGTERARIRSALDSLEDAPTGNEKNVLTLAGRALESASNGGAESHVVLVTREGGLAAALGSDNLIADVRRLRDKGIRVDVVRLSDDEPHSETRAIVAAGGGELLDGEADAALNGSLARVFGTMVPLRATRPVIALRFDSRRVARWRCLNDIDGRKDTHVGNTPMRLYAGASISVLCEVEPVAWTGAASQTQVSATYADASGASRTLTADAAPDSALHRETRLLAELAGFGLWLRHPAELAPMTVDSIAVSLDDAAGYAAELRRLARIAKQIRAQPPK